MRRVGVSVPIAANMKAVAAGYAFTLLLDNDDRLWGVGANNACQLGDGTAVIRETPVQITTQVTEVAAGANAALFLKRDGTVWSTYSGTLPVQVGSNAAAVFSGTSQSYFVTRDGSLQEVRASGGILALAPVVTRIAGEVKAAAGGSEHIAFIKTDSTLWTLGSNYYGELGSGTTNSQSIPVRIADNVAAVAAGYGHTVFLKTDGTVWATGANANGQLGDGTTTNRLAPVLVARDVSKIAASSSYSAWIKTDGTLWGAGQNSAGQLGGELPQNVTTPAQISTGVKFMAAGPTHLVHVRADDLVIASGLRGLGDVSGILARGDSPGYASEFLSTPVLVATDVVSVSASNTNCLYVRADGSLWGFGENSQGQLGDGTTARRITPVKVASDVAMVSSGYSHTVFVKKDGTLWATGDNTYSQLGDGGTKARQTPVQVATDVRTAAAGGAHTMFVKTDGWMWGVGANGGGQLATNADTRGATTPIRVVRDVASVQAGAAHSVFQKIDGSLWGAGSNFYGELGLGNDRFADTPTQLGTQVKSYSAGNNYTLYVRTDGRLWGFGRNDRGQANGMDLSSERQTTPFSVATEVAAVYAGESHTVFVKTDGSAWAMGNTTYARFGDIGGFLLSPRRLIDEMAMAALNQYNTYFIQPAGGTRPSITTAPQSATQTAGTPVALSVTVSGTGPFDYRWRKDGNDIPGARAARYLIPFAVPSDTGRYDVVITNAAGSVTSIAAEISIGAASFTTPPAPSVSVNAGGTLVLDAAVNSPLASRFQWSKDGVALAGATQATYTLAAATASAAGNYTLTVTNALGSITSAPSVVTVQGSRLANLSVRTNAGAGDQVLIVGLAVGGTHTSGSAALLVRAVGPSLAAFGLTGFLADPNLTLFADSTAIATNDDWAGTSALANASASVGAFALSGPTSKDAALLVSPPAGSYTAQVRGATGAEGNVLVEIYDASAASAASAPRLVNVSARARTSGAEGPLIAGFVITGSASKNVLIRATGPALAAFGLPGTLPDPKLDVFRSGNPLPIATNDNWGGAAALANAFAQVGAFGLDPASRDAALVVSLEPGAYTAQVSGVNNASGIALIEIYDLER